MGESVVLVKINVVTLQETYRSVNFVYEVHLDVRLRGSLSFPL